MKIKIPLALSLSLAASSMAEIRLYTERHYPADEVILAQFTEKTGIEIKVLKSGANELLARMKAEKEAPQADLYITVDAASLDRASDAGILAKLDAPELLENLPEGIAPESGTWVPLTMRARVIVYAKERVKPEDAPQTYADLAKSAWKGQVLIRSSSSHYNQSLLASVIASESKAAAIKWAQGVKDNMARPPQGGDRDQIRAVAQGLGDLAVTNSYYLGLLEKSEDKSDNEAREAVTIVFPNQNQRGTHVNISGAGLIKNSKNREESLQLLGYLLTPEVQAQYQELTSEFAVVKGVEPTESQKNWGEFKPDFQSLHELAGHQEDAVKLFDLVGWQ